jgi:hypothetical protein
MSAAEAFAASAASEAAARPLTRRGRLRKLGNMAISVGVRVVCRGGDLRLDAPLSNRAGKRFKS